MLDVYYVPDTVLSILHANPTKSSQQLCEKGTIIFPILELNKRMAQAD